MTDNDIIKALELCATLDSSNCKKCPCQEICNECDGTYNKAVLELINRQKAEIDNLNIELKAMRGSANSYKKLYEGSQKEVERLQQYREKVCMDCEELMYRENKQMKAEIEKKNTEIDILIEKKDTLQDENSELMAEVERLRTSIKEADENFSEGKMGKGLAIIINLVKEMVGDE